MDGHWSEIYNFYKFDFINSYEEIYITPEILKNTLYKKKKLLFEYIKRKTPFLYNDYYIGDFKGVEIILPITKEDAIYNKELYIYLITMADESLYDIGLGHLKQLSERKLDKDIFKKVKMLYFEEIIFKAKDMLGNNEQHNYMYILGDDDNYNKLAILSAIKDGKNVYIYSRKLNEEVSDFVDYIYNETGMYICILTDKAMFIESIKNCNIIINLNKDDLKITHKLKEKSCFIDLTSMGNNCNEIKKIRSDIYTISNVEFFMGNIKIAFFDLHKILEINDKNYMNFLKNRENDFNKEYLENIYNIIGKIK